MSHYQQLKFIEITKQFLPQCFIGVDVLEVGSWDVNGSVRSYFSESNYLGIDINEGQGVDQVCFGQNAAFSSNHFDVIISCECFEHNKYWIETFANMIRMVKPGGAIILTCASIVRGEHGTNRSVAEYSLTSTFNQSDVDYYSNLDVKDFKSTGLLKNFKNFRFYSNIYSRDLYFIGFKDDGISSVDFDEQLRLIGISVSEVKKDGKMTYSQVALAKINYSLRYVLAKFLGERKYHHLIFYIKKIKKNVVESK